MRMVCERGKTRNKGACVANSAQSVKQRLEQLMEQIRRILTLSDRTTEEFNIDRSRELFRQLKKHLLREYTRMSTDKGRAALSDAERTWYQPAIQEIWAKALISSARPDHPPEKWLSVLIDAEDLLRAYLSNLKSAVA
jgi:hypothetical protein